MRTDRFLVPRPGCSARRTAFSLIEVVLAVGVFAVAIVTVLGLLSPTVRSVEESIDSDTAARLAQNISAELARVGFENVRTFTKPAPGNTASTYPVIRLVATRDGARVLRTGEVRSTGDVLNPEAAENNLETGTPPGIAQRDRFFYIEVQRALASSIAGGTAPAHSGAVTPDEGFVPLTVKVLYPYRLPEGPDSGTDDYDADLSIRTPTGNLNTFILNVALTP